MNSMKKLLTALATFGFATITSINAITCSNSSNSDSGILQHFFNNNYKVANDDFGATGLKNNSGTFSFAFGTTDTDGLKATLIKNAIVPTSKTKFFGLGKLLQLDHIPVSLAPATGADLYAVGVYGVNQTGLKADSKGLVSIVLSLYLFKSTQNPSGGYVWKKQDDKPMKITLEVITTPQTDIANIIIYPDLDQIPIAGATPSLNELLFGIKYRNKNAEAQALTVNNIKIKDGTTQTPTDATVVGFGTLTGEVNLTYKKSVIVDLKNIITSPDLDAIVMAGNVPSDDELLAGIQLRNPTTTEVLTTRDFTVGARTNVEADITGFGNYTGTVHLTYTKGDDISQIIARTELGSFSMEGSVPTLFELLTAIITVNPEAGSLGADDIKFKDGTPPTATMATIVGIGSYAGQVTLTYSKS